MEAIFQNVFSKDDEWAKETQKFIFFRRPTMMVLYILMGLYFIHGVVSSALYKEIQYLYIFVPALWVCLVFYLYKKGIKLQGKRQQEFYGKIIDVTASVMENGINYAQSPGVDYFLQFSDIKKIYVYKKYCFVLSRTKLIYTLKNDGFTKGSKEQFIAFAKEKGIKVR